MSGDAQALLDLVRSYAAAEVAPRAAADELGRTDLAGLPFVEELSRAFLTVRLGLSVHTLVRPTSTC